MPDKDTTKKEVSAETTVAAKDTDKTSSAVPEVKDEPEKVAAPEEKPASTEPEILPSAEEKVEPIDIDAQIKGSSQEVKAPVETETKEAEEEKTPEPSSGSSDIPSVDPNASLKIDSLKRPEVPGVDINAPLKIDTDDAASEESKLDKENKKVFILGIVITGIIVLAAGAILFMYFSKSTVKEEQKIEETTQEAPAAKEVKEEAAPAIDRTEWSLEVLNGSGVAGAAKETADTLSELGYVIDKTGNADKDDYETTELLVSSDKTEDEKKAILADMKKELGVTEITGELEDSDADARIVIGKAE